MTLHEEIRESIKDAMRAKDTVKLTTLRGLLAACTNELVAIGRMPQGELTDDEAITVLKRAVKQRKDAAEQFITGGRADLAENEQAELAVLESYLAKYLPPQMSDDEIVVIAKTKAAELGVVDKGKAGVLMAALMKELKGKADGAAVKAAVDKVLTA